MSNKPMFITLEGVDGAGKSSHMETIMKIMDEHGLEVLLTREPGGTEVGKVLRQQLKGAVTDPRTAALIAFADRNEHLQTKIVPALQEGKVVISDRFVDSTFAYQCSDGCEYSFVSELEELVLDEPIKRPSLTLFFDLSPEQAEKRRMSRPKEEGLEKDLFDEKSVVWFNKVRDIYLKRVEDNPERFIVIDGSQSIENVAKQVHEKLSEFVVNFQNENSSKRVLGNRPR